MSRLEWRVIKLTAAAIATYAVFQAATNWDALEETVGKYVSTQIRQAIEGKENDEHE